MSDLPKIALNDEAIEILRERIFNLQGQQLKMSDFFTLIQLKTFVENDSDSLLYLLKDRIEIGTMPKNLFDCDSTYFQIGHRLSLS